MTHILYAGYKDRIEAERAFGELLELGVATEDLSLVARATLSRSSVKRRARRSVDSGMSHPEDYRIFPGRVEAEGLPDVESSIGGGISTSTYNDDVSGIEEMDDASNVAENVAEPLVARSYGEEDAADARKFAALGSVDASRPTSRGFGTGPTNGRPKSPDRQFTIEVIGRAEILGDGLLATEMLSTEIKDHDRDPDRALIKSLLRLGVSEKACNGLVVSFSTGGAVLAVTEEPGRIRLEQIEAIVKSTGGQRLRVFELLGA